jgi:hypothetical protein
VDRPQLKKALADLASRGRITSRDERLLEYLRELHVMSLDQIKRLFWPNSQEVTAYNRLWFLVKHHLLSRARIPAAEMKAWGLPPKLVYALGVGGRMWLLDEVEPSLNARHLRREQVLHDLLVAEFFVRLFETVSARGAEWSLTWAGEQAAGFHGARARDVPIVSPDGLAIVQQQRGQKVATLPLLIELDKGREAHGRPSSDWGKKVHGYDRFYSEEQGGEKVWKMHPQLSDLPTFPLVVVITHGERRLLNLVQAIKGHRHEPVGYCLALWPDLMAGEDLLAVPAWLKLTAEGKVIGQEPGQRQPLLVPAKGG